MPKLNRLDKVQSLSVAEAAYIAGFLDADGCIMLQIKKRASKEHRLPYHFHPIVSLSNTRIEVLHWIQGKCGGFGFIQTFKPNNRKWTTSHALYFSSSVIKWLLPQIEPYLITKLGQARLLMEYCDLTSHVKGSKLKTDACIANMPRYLAIYDEIKCLNQNIQYSVVKNKSGELLETPESHANHSGTGNGDCEGFKNCMDWTTSSQAYQACVSIIGGKVQRLAAENARSDKAATSARSES